MILVGLNYGIFPNKMKLQNKKKYSFSCTILFWKSVIWRSYLQWTIY